MVLKEPSLISLKKKKMFSNAEIQDDVSLKVSMM